MHTASSLAPGHLAGQCTTVQYGLCAPHWLASTPLPTLAIFQRTQLTTQLVSLVGHITVRPWPQQRGQSRSRWDWNQQWLNSANCACMHIPTTGVGSIGITDHSSVESIVGGTGWSEVMDGQWSLIPIHYTARSTDQLTWSLVAQLMCSKLPAMLSLAAPTLRKHLVS